MMAEMRAMWQMSQLSQMLAQQNSTAQNPTSAAPASQKSKPDAAKELVQAVTQLLENRSNKGSSDTRLINTIKRLRELMGKSSIYEPFVVENHPAFKQLRAELTGLADTVDARGKQLGGIQRTADETQNTTKDMFSEMRTFMSSPPSWPSSEKGGVPRNPGEPAAPDEAADLQVPLALFG